MAGSVLSGLNLMQFASFGVVSPLPTDTPMLGKWIKLYLGFGRELIYDLMCCGIIATGKVKLGVVLSIDYHAMISP